MFSWKFLFVLLGVVAYACELRSSYPTNCVVTAQLANGTQFSCDKGYAYCCDTFIVTASEASTWVGCPGVASSKANSVRFSYIAKFITNSSLLACQYANDFFGETVSNGTHHGSIQLSTGTSSFIGGSTGDLTTASMTSQFCNYQVSGFEAYSQ